MVSTRRKRKQNSTVFTQLNDLPDNFLIGKDYLDTHTGIIEDTIGENVASCNTNHLIPTISSEVDMQTLERSISSRVRSEVDKEVKKVTWRNLGSNGLFVIT